MYLFQNAHIYFNRTSLCLPGYRLQVIYIFSDGILLGLCWCYVGYVGIMLVVIPSLNVDGK